MSSVLERYSKPSESAKPTASTQAPAPRGRERSDYKAYSAPSEHEPRYLVFLRNKDGHTAPSYDRLDEIGFDPGGTWVILSFGFMVAKISGRGLFKLAQELLDHKVEWVREFNAAVHKPLLDDSPIITEIQLIYRGSAASRALAQSGEPASGAF